MCNLLKTYSFNSIQVLVTLKELGLDNPMCNLLKTTSFNSIQVSVTLKELGLDNPSGYYIEDLYDEHVYGVVTPDRRFKVDVNPSGSK